MIVDVDGGGGGDDDWGFTFPKQSVWGNKHIKLRVGLASSPFIATPSAFAFGLKACCRKRTSQRASPICLSFK